MVKIFFYGLNDKGIFLHIAILRYAIITFKGLCFLVITFVLFFVSLFLKRLFESLQVSLVAKKIHPLLRSTLELGSL